MELYKQIGSNKRRSILLVATLVVVLVALSVVISFAVNRGQASVGLLTGIVAVAIVVSILMTIASYWWSDKIALATSHAIPVTQEQAPQLYNVIDGLCAATGLPRPRIYIVDDPAPNAFATGRNPQHAAIAVTTGLLQILGRDELEGVLAHELSHIRNYDILVESMVVVLAGAIALMADFFLRAMFWGGRGRRSSNSGGDQLGFIFLIIGLVMAILLPIVAQFIQLAVSRKRESLADVSAIDITRYPTGLRRALEKLQDDKAVVRTASKATAHLWFESPLDTKGGRASRFNKMFLTHPPLGERIAVVRKIENSGRPGDIVAAPPAPPIGAPKAWDYVHLDRGPSGAPGQVGQVGQGGPGPGAPPLPPVPGAPGFQGPPGSAPPNPFSLPGAPPMPPGYRPPQPPYPPPPQPPVPPR